jgi:ribosomal protein S18 acetylase RimI-like enzyme
MIIETLKDHNQYLDLHRQVFGDNIVNVTVPDIVQIVKKDDGEIIGFLSGYEAHDNSFYIQYAGILPEFRKKGFIRHFKSMLSDNTAYITATENTNITAMKTLMAVGFLPIGGRFGGDLKYYVEWARRANNG